MNRSSFIWALLAVATLLSPALTAASITWSGAGDGTTWTDSANWTGNAVPGAADEAVFDGTVAPTTVTGLNGSVQRIAVNSGANPALTITFALSSNVTLTGTGGNSLSVAAGDAVGFSSTSATVQTLQIEDDADINGSLSTDATVNLRTATGTPTLSLGDNSTFSLAGALEINADTTLLADDTSASTSINIADLRIDGSSVELDTAGGNPAMTLGAVTFLGASPYFGGYNLLSSSDSWTVTLNGDIDLGAATGVTMEADYVEFITPATSMISVSGGSASFWWWGVLNVPSGGSLSIAAGLWTATAPGGNFFLPYRVDVAGNFDAGGNSLWIYGDEDGSDGPGITVASGGTFTQTGFTLLSGDSNSDINLLTGNFAFDGDVTLFFGDWRVALGSDVTFNGNVDADPTGEGYIGADEDGAATAGMAIVRFNGSFSLSPDHFLHVGEGNHYFAGDIDLSAADDRVVGPTNPNTDPTVHLVGAAQAIDFSGGGSYFIVTSVAATTSVTQSGLMVLAGDMNLAASTQTVVWTAATGALIEVGDGSFPVDGTLTMGNADMNIGAFTVWQVDNGNINEFTSFTIVRAAGATGVINMVGNLRVDGDTIENDLGPSVQDEFNAARLTIDGAEIVLDPTVLTPLLEVQVTDGGNDGFQYGPPPAPSAVLPVDFEGNGGTLELINGAALSAALIKVGYAESQPVTGQPAPPLSEQSGSRLSTDGASLTLNVPGTGNGLTSGHFAAMDLLNATISGAAAYKIESVPETLRVAFLNSSVTTGSGSGPQRVKVFLGALNIYAVDSTFDKLDSSGFWVRPMAVVKAFNGNTFTNNAAAPSSPPAHITLQMLGAGSAQFWDNNHFDNSVGTGTGGLLVNIMSAGAPVQFRVPAGSPFGFGVVGFNVTAAQAEAADNDGSTVGVDVTWNDAANQVSVADESAGLPAGLVTNSAVTHQTVMLFGLSSSPGNVIVNGVTLEVDAYGSTLDDSDVASFTLFNDANQNGTYDTGEEFAAATLNAVYAGGGTMTFDLAGAGVPQLIVVGTPQHWGVSVRFAASGNGLAGGLIVDLLPGGITSTDIVDGLPLFTDHIVTGPATQLAIITQPGGAAAGVVLAPQPVIELRDSLGNRVLGDSSTMVNASILTDPVGGSVLGGTTGVTAVDGHVTFTNLSINKAGVGFVLRFTSGAMTVDSDPITITAAPSGGGGGDDDEGCTTGGVEGLPLMLLVALGALAVVGIRRLRNA